MATNGVLVTDASSQPDIRKYFARYVTIPSYETPREAREVCGQLLRDEQWRRDIVQASQHAIEEGHRFRHRIQDLQEISGVDLTSSAEGGIKILQPQEFYDPIQSRLLTFRRIASWWYRNLREVIAEGVKITSGGLK